MYSFTYLSTYTPTCLTIYTLPLTKAAYNMHTLFFQNKCTRYWPAPGETSIYGSGSVFVEDEISNPHYILRKFLIQNGDEVSGI